LKLEECFSSAGWGYVIEASLLNLLSNKRFPERGRAVFKVDTGFRGPVMVTADIFELLGLSDFEVPEDLRPSYSTLAGPVEMRSAPALLELGGQEMETDVLTPYNAPSRMLLGFEVLRQLDLALIRDRICFLKIKQGRKN
jgi:clan AA aspartic protease